MIFEPFKIKVVEPIYRSTAEERQRWMEEAGNNVFGLRAEQVMIDLLTDSGTSAMSHDQWAALTAADESYAGSKSFFEFEAAAQRVFGKRIVIPVHQGRAGEHLVFSTLVKKGDLIPSNGHFDTTIANLLDNGGESVSLMSPDAADTQAFKPFKGNMDLKRLSALLAAEGGRVPFVMMSLTNNSCGGQPASLENIEAVHKLCVAAGKPLFIDACRFAENSFFIKLRESSCASMSAAEIAAKCFSFASLIIFSAKKDAFANIGGLVCLDDPVLGERLKDKLILFEGFPTYGGLAGRDMAAIAQGLKEVLDEEYLRYRLRTIEWMVERLLPAGVPVLVPAGGHGIYLDGAKFFETLPPDHLPGLTLAAELYLRAGVRGVELGNVAFGRRDAQGRNSFPTHDLVRLAMPRRTYTEAHATYVVEQIIELYNNRAQVRGFDFEYEAPTMRHFRSRFKRRT